jgi:hypothetical protein
MPTTRARGTRPYWLMAAWLASSSAQAPSFTPEALHAFAQVGDVGIVNPLHLRQRCVGVAKAHGGDERGKVRAEDGHNGYCAVPKEGENRPFLNPRKDVFHGPLRLLLNHIPVAIGLYIALHILR